MGRQKLLKLARSIEMYLLGEKLWILFITLYAEK